MIKLLDIVVSEELTKGEVEVGLTQISEIVPHPTVELAGPLPADIQVYTVFSGGIAPASHDGAAALVQFLTSLAVVSVLKANGMEPLSRWQEAGLFSFGGFRVRVALSCRMAFAATAMPSYIGEWPNGGISARFPFLFFGDCCV